MISLQDAEKARQHRSRIVQALNVEGGISRRSESLSGVFRSPRSILEANGSHEVRFVPPRPFTRCSLADGLFEHPVEMLPYSLVSHPLPFTPHS